MNPHPREANQLLAALPAKEWAKLMPYFEKVPLVRGQVLMQEGEAYHKLYFPTSGIISTVSTFETGASVDIATIGREGMVEVGAILGGSSGSHQQMVQMAGSALAVSFAAFNRLHASNAAFQRILLAYARVFLEQVLQTVACNSIHTAEERASRWLLTCHDQIDGDTFALTQEFFAEFLGVSRPTVSLIARTLQQAGLIRYKRGLITVEDRTGLEETACVCYGDMRRRYDESCLKAQNGC
jgi:CRP-like cAMP-binding protein